MELSGKRKAVPSKALGGKRALSPTPMCPTDYILNNIAMTMTAMLNEMRIKNRLLVDIRNLMQMRK